VKYLIDSIAKAQALPHFIRERQFSYSPSILRAKRIIRVHLERSIREWQLRHPTSSSSTTSPPTSTASASDSNSNSSEECDANDTASSLSSFSVPSSKTNSDNDGKGVEQSDENDLPEDENNMMARMLHSLNQPEGLTKDEIMDELMLFVFGGYETTATTLAWFVYYMSLYGDKQDKMREEIKQVLGDNVPTLETLNQLTYVDHVMKETFRMAPTASMTSRTCLEDTLIDGYPVKAGTSVMIFLHSLQMDPRQWKIDPTLFVPERFESEDKDHDYYAFGPFGGGQRACVGQQLAKLEAKIIAVRLIQKFTIQPAPGNTGGHRQSITIQPKNVSVYLVPN